MQQLVERKVTLDLTDVGANAFDVMRAFFNQARKEDWSRGEIDTVLEEAKKGDYDHLIQVIMAHSE